MRHATPRGARVAEKDVGVDEPDRADEIGEDPDRTAPYRRALVTITEEPSPSRRRTPTFATRPLEVGEVRATLTIVAGVDAGRTVALGVGPSVVGRGPEADVVVADPAVSRTHARFVRDTTGYAVQDLGSTNGTFVRGAPVREARLAPGDHVQLGPRLLLRFAMLDGAGEALQRELFDASMRDPLTRVFNRRYLDQRLPADVRLARRGTDVLSVLLVDIDHFKELNDRHGHLAGDRALSAVASRLVASLRETDYLVRWGGEEFVAVVRGRDHAAALRTAERLRRAVAVSPVRAGHDDLPITVSIGVASLGEVPTGDASRALLALADRRLYVAKTGGRNRVVGAPATGDGDVR